MCIAGTGVAQVKDNEPFCILVSTLEKPKVLLLGQTIAQTQFNPL